MKYFLTIFLLFHSLAFAKEEANIQITEDTLFASNTVNIPIVYYPLDKKSPTIILGHACGGPNHLKDWPDILKSWGYNVVIPHSLSGRGYTTICGSIEKVSPKVRAKDIDETVKWVLSQPWHEGKIGYIGFSHGAVVGQYISNHYSIKPISAIVNFYPKCNYYKEDEPKIPTQINIGDSDDWTPSHLCKSLSHKNYQINYYQGAYHGFDQNRKPIIINGRTLISYNRDAHALSINYTREFIKKYVY